MKSAVICPICINCKNFGCDDKQSIVIKLIESLLYIRELTDRKGFIKQNNFYRTVTYILLYEDEVL